MPVGEQFILAKEHSDAVGLFNLLVHLYHGSVNVSVSREGSFSSEGPGQVTH